jgi:hypothetical protein
MSKAITHGNWALEHEDGTPVVIGETLSTGRGDRYVITGGRAPHKPSSTGRVFVEGGSEFFPNVFDLKWVEHDDFMDSALQAQMAIALLDMIQLAYDATQYSADNPTQAEDRSRIKTAQAVLLVYQRQAQKK